MNADPPTRTAAPRPAAGGPGGSGLVDVASRSSVRATLTAVIEYRELLKHLVLKDLKLKYRGSWLGFVWSLVNPLVMLVVYTVAFKYIMAIRSGGFVFLLLIGILTWTFFAGSLAMGAGGIVDNGGLMKSVFFPRAVLPIATVLFNLAQFLLTAAVFIPVLSLIYGIAPGIPILALPVVLLLNVLMTIGLALALATGTAYFRDLRHLLEIALAIMFWTTPIVYDFRAIPEAWQLVVLFSPLTPFVLGYQSIIYYGEWPGPAVWGLEVVYAAAALTLGAVLFSRFQDQFAEQV
jgi:lipopolysaccharide transport system permease protein